MALGQKRSKIPASWEGAETSGNLEPGFPVSRRKQPLAPADCHSPILKDLKPDTIPET